MLVLKKIFLKRKILSFTDISIVTWFWKKSAIQIFYWQFLNSSKTKGFLKNIEKVWFIDDFWDVYIIFENVEDFKLYSLYTNLYKNIPISPKYVSFKTNFRPCNFLQSIISLVNIFLPDTCKNGICDGSIEQLFKTSVLLIL